VDGSFGLLLAGLCCFLLLLLAIAAFAIVATHARAE
jgi:hypothetical protein